MEKKDQTKLLPCNKNMAIKWGNALRFVGFSWAANEKAHL